MWNVNTEVSLPGPDNKWKSYEVKTKCYELFMI